MRTSLALAAVPLVFLVAPSTGLPQSTPYAGAWNGTMTQQQAVSCTCTGAGCPWQTSAFSCNVAQSWSATVDPQGSVTVSTGAGTIACTNGTSSVVPATGPLPSGRLQPDGTIAFPAYSFSIPNGSGSCAAYTVRYSPSPPSASSTMPCTWASTSDFGNYSVACSGESQATMIGVRTAPYAAPPFPMTVSSNINETTATATAQVQPPTQLVGSVASVYVFAHARQSALAPKRITDAPSPTQAMEDSPDPCVLAQLGSNGQLAAASASTLQPYTTGVIGSQGQSVTILNNVSTPNVAGASFYVGYGETSSEMLSSGLYEGAVTVQGSDACSAALLTGAAPKGASALSGLWWNRNESGWGVSFTQRRNVLFAAWYTYDATGNPKWYVASNCEMPSGVTGSSGTCNGPLYEVSGPVFFGAPFDPLLTRVTTAGTLQVTFRDADNATMSYTANGQSRTAAITRQSIQTGTTPPAVDYTDLWWNPNESGWGIAITQQYGLMFLTWYVYDASGRPMWYVASACVVVGSRCSGDLYQTTGPPLGPVFDPSAVRVTKAGNVSVTFIDANTAQLAYTVNGVTGVKTITRQVF